MPTKKRDKHNLFWTLLDEKHYLDGLGDWNQPHDGQMERPDLLRLYDISLDLRQPPPPWKEEAREYVRELLRQEVGG